MAPEYLLHVSKKIAAQFEEIIGQIEGITIVDKKTSGFGDLAVRATAILSTLDDSLTIRELLTYRWNKSPDKSALQPWFDFVKNLKRGEKLVLTTALGLVAYDYPLIHDRMTLQEARDYDWSQLSLRGIGPTRRLFLQRAFLPPSP